MKESIFHFHPLPPHLLLTNDLVENNICNLMWSQIFEFEFNICIWHTIFHRMSCILFNFTNLSINPIGSFYSPNTQHKFTYFFQPIAESKVLNIQYITPAPFEIDFRGGFI